MHSHLAPSLSSLASPESQSLSYNTDFLHPCPNQHITSGPETRSRLNTAHDTIHTSIYVKFNSVIIATKYQLN